MANEPPGSNDDTPSNVTDRWACNFLHVRDTGGCTGRLKSGRQCRTRAVTIPPRYGYFQTCRKHSSQRKRAGKCQATEQCGHVCLALADYDPPFHLCLRHSKGTDTLPCHLLRIPKELRLMIFRYLFPDLLEHCHKRRLGFLPLSLLKLNRTIYEEAISIINRETKWEIRINETDVMLPYGEWRHGDPAMHGVPSGSLLKNHFHQKALGRVQNLVVRIEFGNRFYNFSDDPEEHLFLIRDMVRKVVDLLGVHVTRQELHVKLCPHKRPFGWNDVDVRYATYFVLEPLKELNVTKPRLELTTDMYNTETYQDYRHEWEQSLRASNEDLSVGTNAQLRQRYQSKTEARSLLLKIETLIDFLKFQVVSRDRWDYDEASENHRPKVLRSIIREYSSPLRVAQAASEQCDIVLLREIRDAIMVKWEEYQRKIEEGHIFVAKAWASLFDDQDQDFQDWGQDVEKYNAMKHYWKDLRRVNHDLPNRDDRDVIFTEDTERQYFRRGDREWIVLKTPEVMRAEQERRNRN